MKTTKTSYISLLFFLCSLYSMAQKVVFKSESSSQQVKVGEHFRVGFYLISDSRSISLDEPIDFPNFKGFQVLDENNIRNFQVVNGEMQSSSGLELTLLAEKEGNFKIGAAKVTINGKTYATKPIEISVSERSYNANNSSSNKNQGIFLASEVNNKNPFINEAINLSVKLYARDYSVFSRRRNFKRANFTGFDSKVIPEEEMGDRMKQEMVNGRVYVSEELVRYLLFPQDAGNIKIEPFSIDIAVGYYGTEPVTISSNPISLNVKGLPAGKPASFKGAVGDFKMNTSVDKKELKANESANVEIEIYGEGNLNNISLPDFKGNDYLEVYAPKKRENLGIGNRGFEGKIAESFVIVPQYGGKFALDPIEFTYFNPKTEKYVTLKSQPVELDVKGDPAPEKVDSTARIGEINDYLSNAGKETDVLPNITQNLPENVKQSLENNTWYWILGMLALIGAGISYYFSRKKKDENNNGEVEVSVNQNKSVKIQKQEKPKSVKKVEYKTDLEDLKNLASEGGNSFFQKEEELLIHLGQNITGLDLANFTDTNVVNKMKELNIQQEFITEWQRLLGNARQAKYGASSQDIDVYQILIDIEKLINQLK